MMVGGGLKDSGTDEPKKLTWLLKNRKMFVGK
jgi:hypothetical protein